MLDLSRSRKALLLGLLGFGAVASTWLATSYPRARREAADLENRVLSEAALLAERLSAGLSEALQKLVASENERPYFQYQNLYHDPQTASVGPSVAPSPLARGELDPLIAIHFHIDESGTLTVPSINEELPELSNPKSIDRDRLLLARLRAHAGELRQHEITSPVTVAQVENLAFAQNQAPNQVFQSIQKQLPPLQAQQAGKVAIKTRDFVWRRMKLDDRSELIALRTVATPDGEITQGFWVSPKALDAWLADRQRPGLTASWRWAERSAEGDGTAHARNSALVALPVAELAETQSLDSPLLAVVDAHAAMAAARSAGTVIVRRFWSQYVPAMVLLLSTVLAMVMLVARAEQLARERAQFAAAAAHELRTPLASLQLYGDMLAAGLGDRAKSAHYARLISEEASRLGRVVSNVLELSRLERGALQLRTRTDDVIETIRRSVERARPILARSNMAILFEPQGPVMARYDADAVGRILDNLLDNAEKYTRGTLDRTVEIHVAQSTERVSITVADNGPGLPAHLQQNPFVAFRRGKDDDLPAGLGLGLSLSRQLARALGGELESAPGPGGARLTLHLPYGLGPGPQVTDI